MQHVESNAVDCLDHRSEGKAVSAQALAEILDCDVSSVSRMARLDIIPSISIGPKLGERRFFLSKVLEALQARSRGPIRSKQRHKQTENHEAVGAEA